MWTMKRIELVINVKIDEVTLKLTREVEIDSIKEELDKLGDLILSSVDPKAETKDLRA